MGVHGVRHGAHKTDPQAHVGRDDRSADHCSGRLARGVAECVSCCLAERLVHGGGLGLARRGGHRNGG